MYQPLEVILVGSPGTGKSTLARALKEVLKKYGVKKVTSVSYIPDGGDWGHETLEWEDNS